MTNDDLHRALIAEIRDIKDNHLSSIYARLGSLESDGHWIKKLMAGVFGGVVVIAGSLLALVAKAF